MEIWQDGGSALVTNPEMRGVPEQRRPCQLARSFVLVGADKLDGLREEASRVKSTAIRSIS